MAVCGCCHSVWRKPPSLCPACVFPLVQECPCFLGVLDLCHLCSFDISVSSLLSMCHIYFYVVTLSSPCLLSSARVSLLPRCPRSMSSVFILHLCNLYTKMCPPLGQDCPCFLCVHDLCHLCLFDIFVVPSHYLSSVFQ